jgi:hypothetical protein
MERIYESRDFRCRRRHRSAHCAGYLEHEITAVPRDPEGFERIDSAVRFTKGAATGSASAATTVRGPDALVGADDPNKRGQSRDVLAQAAHGLIAGAHRAAVRRLMVLRGAGRIEVAAGIQAVDTPDSLGRSRERTTILTTIPRDKVVLVASRRPFDLFFVQARQSNRTRCLESVRKVANG